jgi:YVTN family beta-propeller protein
MKTLPVVLAFALAAAPAVGQWVEDSLPVGGNFVYHLIYNPVSDAVYGISNTGYRFFAIACSSNTVVQNVRLTYPLGIAYNRLGNKAYVSYGLDWDSLVVVDGATHTLGRRVYLGDASYLAWDSIGNRVYAAQPGSASVAVLDCATDSVIGTIPVGLCPTYLHVNPLRRKLYVQNDDDYTVSIVDMTTNQVIKTVYVGRYLDSGWYDSECDKYYCGKTGEAVVFSGETDTILYRIPLGGSVDAVGGG